MASRTETLSAKPIEQTALDWREVIKFGALLALTLFWMIPFFSALITSFRTMNDINVNGFWSLPREITLDNFVSAWQRGNVNKYLLNSFIITLPSLVGMLFFSTPSAYALARFRFRLNRFFYFMFVAGTLLPFQVLMLPVFRLTNILGLYDTYWALIFFHTAFQLGFCTFVLRNFMRTVPEDILDAARVDGCNEFRIYWQIMLPLSLPALAALATLEFTWVFNDYLWAIILIKSDSLRPVTAGLATLQGQYITDWPVIVAGALIATLPTVIVFFALQRYFIQGLTLGSGK
ncbi:MAG: carbohydrate ABC transporter permease [Anaerolineae bacterium]|nr:carbohydrate ABC transporter permease [Anaerolineae bacterium]